MSRINIAFPFSPSIALAKDSLTRAQVSSFKVSNETSGDCLTLTVKKTSPPISHNAPSLESYIPQLARKDGQRGLRLFTEKTNSTPSLSTDSANNKVRFAENDGLNTKRKSHFNRQQNALKEWSNSAENEKRVTFKKREKRLARLAECLTDNPKAPQTISAFKFIEQRIQAVWEACLARDEKRLAKAKHLLAKGIAAMEKTKTEIDESQQSFLQKIDKSKHPSEQEYKKWNQLCNFSFDLGRKIKEAHQQLLLDTRGEAEYEPVPQMPE